MTDTRKTKSRDDRKTPRTVMFNLRLTVSEYEEMKRKAAAEYTTLSTWARRVLLAAEEKMPWDE